MAYMLSRAVLVLLAWGVTCGLIAGASWAAAGELNAAGLDKLRHNAKLRCARIGGRFFRTPGGCK